MSVMVRMLTTVGREAAAIVLPSPCAVCGSELPWRDRRGSCCGSCWRSLPGAAGHRCRVCSLFLDTAADEATCGECIKRPPPFEWIESYGPYEGGLDRLVSAFKFDRHHFLASPLSELLTVALDRRELHFDALCGVPMEPRRERARGFNQAELLARELARRTGIPHERSLLRRTGTARVQSSLPRSDRRRNVRGRFVASDGCRGRSVLVVDDICTTSETLRECARVLRRSGATSVAAVTIARA